ncbi:MAG TPA: DUF1552 domain-containing protein [Polyangiaceae bacterium]|nr:DUF1552 domain-containing protein [Polyangiaceae bacterium]
MSSARPLDHRTELSRRRLLRGLGALSVALTSPVWRASTVFGQDARVPVAKRFIGIFSANGTIASQFFPQPTSASVQLSLPRILAPLEKHKAKLLVLKGVHMNSTVEDELGKPSANKPGGPHMKGPGAMLTGGSLLAGSFGGAGGPAGYADRISVDQLIAQRIGAGMRFPSLEIGVRTQGQEPLRVISYRGANQPNNPIQDPWQLYSRMFADRDLSATDLQRKLAERRSVLDFLKDDLNRLGGRVSAEDKKRLDAHLTGIRSIEQGLATSSSACTPLQMPGKIDPNAMQNYPAIGKLQMDLMLLAHSCGLTRVSTFMWANANSWQFYPWIGINEEHHELSHAGDNDAASTEKLVKISVWHAEQVAYVLDRLAAIPEIDGGNMLDSTVLLWGNELGVGNSHSYKNVPWLLAGGAGGYFKMGRSLQFQNQPHNNLLLSVCHAMGLTDVNSFGIPALCTGPLAELRA